MDFWKSFLVFNEQKPLLFTGAYFWIFFALAMTIYSVIYNRLTLRSLYLFIISLFFYYKSSGGYFFLLIFSTIVDYSISIGIFRSRNNGYRKLLLILSIIINLGLLAYYKYSYFVIGYINEWFGTSFAVTDQLAVLGNSIFNGGFDIDDIILPVGISFYTFQTMSYTIDVYRKKLNPVRNIIDFGFYVSFFPQLVAGPIVRASEFIPQIYEKYKLSKEEFGMAVFLILNGLLKKMIISDYISINFVDRVFDNPGSFTGFENLMAVYGYAIQIYCDFSGYTDIAIGIALLMGFRLLLNFNSPYKANNITDFWRRWHISLSSWLKDYLYISLGGNRKGKFRQNVNLLLTMLLGGLWHGANFRFVIWGGLHGLGLVIHKAWMRYVPLSQSKSRLMHILGVLITFHFVCFAWIFFRAADMEKVQLLLDKIFNDFNLSLIPQILSSYWKIFAIMFAGYFIHWLPVSFKDSYKNIFVEMPYWIKALAVIVVIILVFQARSSEVQPFIYFQF